MVPQLTVWSHAMSLLAAALGAGLYSAERECLHGAKENLPAFLLTFGFTADNLRVLVDELGVRRAGRRLYATERERMYGAKKRRTERLAARAARRSRTLALAYSASVAASYLILVFNAAAALPQ